MEKFLAKPGFLGTYGSLGADLSYLLAVMFTVLFLIGWYKGKNHKGNSHHGLTLWGMAAMLVYFSAYYLIRRLGVLALEGREGFGGSELLYNYVFTPILTAHILLVTIGILIAPYIIILGFRASVKKNGRRVLKDDELKVKKKSFYIPCIDLRCFRSFSIYQVPYNKVFDGLCYWFFPCCLTLYFRENYRKVFAQWSKKTQVFREAYYGHVLGNPLYQYHNLFFTLYHLPCKSFRRLKAYRNFLYSAIMLKCTLNIVRNSRM